MTHDTAIEPAFMVPEYIVTCMCGWVSDDAYTLIDDAHDAAQAHHDRPDA